MKKSLRESFAYTQEELDTLLKAFHALLTDVLAGRVDNRYAGICGNIRIYGVRGMRTSALISSLGSEWPHSSKPGDRSNATPVPGDYGVLAPMGRLWKKKQLEYRIDLIRYIIKRLRDWKRRTRQ